MLQLEPFLSLSAMESPASHNSRSDCHRLQNGTFRWSLRVLKSVINVVVVVVDVGEGGGKRRRRKVYGLVSTPGVASSKTVGAIGYKKLLPISLSQMGRCSP